MNAIMLTAALSRPVPHDDKTIVLFRAPADADLRSATGAVDGPEDALQVTFAGLDPEAQRRALNSFPGARRFVLASN